MADARRQSAKTPIASSPRCHHDSDPLEGSSAALPPPPKKSRAKKAAAPSSSSISSCEEQRRHKAMEKAFLRAQAKPLLGKRIGPPLLPVPGPDPLDLCGTSLLMSLALLLEPSLQTPSGFFRPSRSLSSLLQVLLLIHWLKLLSLLHLWQILWRPLFLEQFAKA